MASSSEPNNTIRPEYNLKVLGAPAALLVSGKVHKFTNRKHLALLAYLTMEPGEYTREQLTRFVWSAGASGSIDNALSELRAAFGPELIPPRAQKITLPRGLVDVDALAVLTGGTDPARRAAAVELYRGGFLEEFNARGSSERFTRWVVTTRAKLEEEFRQLCVQECEASSAHGDWARVIAVAERGMRKSPGWAPGAEWRETAERALRAEPARGAGAEEEPGAEPVAANPEPPPTSPAEPRSALRVSVRGSTRIGRMLFNLWPVLLVVLVALVAHLYQDSILLVRMPPIRVDELPAPGSPIRTRSDWLRTDGQWIYYRYEWYMPEACQHETVATGNFGRTGWRRGVPVVCLNAAWLAVDAHRLVRRFSLAPETTYCLQFLYIEDQESFWGMHGAEGAPGLDSIRVVAPSGEYNIGFAVIREGPGQHHVELTHRYPSVRC